MKLQFQSLPLFPNFQLEIPDGETPNSVSLVCFVLGNVNEVMDHDFELFRQFFPGHGFNMTFQLLPSFPHTVP